MPNINTTMDSDSDDYCDIAEEVIEDDIVDTHQEPVNNNNGHRGADIEWLEMARFETSEMYKDSEYFKDTEDFFTMRRARETFHADTEHFTCKYSRKKGFVKFAKEYKIFYFTTSEEVAVKGISTMRMNPMKIVDLI